MPLLSIVIPTHNRQKYAEVAARKTHEACPDAEIVVSDTSNDESLGTALADLIEAGVVTYVRPGRPLDIVSHFEFALRHAGGDYLMFIGDDDCVGPGLSEIVRWAARNEVEAVVCYAEKFQVVYYWPGVTSRFYGSAYSGTMFVSPFHGAAQPIDPIAALKGALGNLGRGLGTMPRVYHGLASRRVIERVRAQHGTLFGGVTPDIYSAALISSQARNVWQIDFPFCIPGGSAPSTAGTAAAGEDTSNLRAHAHLAPFEDLSWDPLIPEVYAPFTVWAFSLTRAAERLDRGDLKPNYARVYAMVLLYRPRSIGALGRAISAHAAKAGWAGTLAAVAREVLREVGFQARRFGSRLLAPRAGGSARRISNLPSIAASYDALVAFTEAERIAPELPPLAADGSGSGARAGRSASAPPGR